MCAVEDKFTTPAINIAECPHCQSEKLSYGTYDFSSKINVILECECKDCEETFSYGFLPELKKIEAVHTEPFPPCEFEDMDLDRAKELFRNGSDSQLLKSIPLADKDRCPSCESVDLEYEDYEFNDYELSNSYTRQIHCPDCDNTIEETYELELIDIEIYIDGEYVVYTV